MSIINDYEMKKFNEELNKQFKKSDYLNIEPERIKEYISNQAKLVEDMKKREQELEDQAEYLKAVKLGLNNYDAENKKVWDKNRKEIREFLDNINEHIEKNDRTQQEMIKSINNLRSNEEKEKLLKTYEYLLHDAHERLLIATQEKQAAIENKNANLAIAKIEEIKEINNDLGIYINHIEQLEND